MWLSCFFFFCYLLNSLYAHTDENSEEFNENFIISLGNVKILRTTKIVISWGTEYFWYFCTIFLKFLRLLSKISAQIILKICTTLSPEILQNSSKFTSRTTYFSNFCKIVPNCLKIMCRNSVTDLGVFEENITKRYWGGFEEITRNSKRNWKSFEKIL